MIVAPTSQKYFQMGNDKTILLAFWLPDVFLLALGSLVLSYLIFVRHDFKNIVVWFVVGAISYATLYCVAFAWMTDTGWLGVMAMLSATIISGNFAIGLTPVFRKLMFRRSKDGKTQWILTKTLTQILVVWTLILVIFPLLIVQIEAKIGIPHFSIPFQKIFGIVLFPLISAIGLIAAYSMAKIGRGTPLPMDTTNKLVVSGIYAYIRNPMAVSGIGQSLLVGFILGSPLVLLYALLGAFIWKFIYQKLEEDDLLEQFGADYEEYRKKVKSIIPSFQPYKK